MRRRRRGRKGNEGMKKKVKRVGMKGGCRDIRTLVRTLVRASLDCQTDNEILMHIWPATIVSYFTSFRSRSFSIVSGSNSLTLVIESSRFNLTRTS